MAITQNLDIFAGTDVTLEFVIDEDIAGYTFDLVVSHRKQDPTPLLVETADVDSETRVVSVSLSKAQTAALGVGVFPYELARTNPGAEDVFTVGSLTVEPRVGA